jgi:hypothetical protein
MYVLNYFDALPVLLKCYSSKLARVSSDAVEGSAAAHARTEVELHSLSPPVRIFFFFLHPGIGSEDYLRSGLACPLTEGPTSSRE